ncbi:MAG: PIN domain-containing protein [Candidatus Magasanikbacteria bacterium]
MKKKIVDANVIIRYLAEDDLDKAERAENLFLEAEPGELRIPDMVMAEIVWVLGSYYELEKKEILEKLKAILAFEKLDFNRDILEKAIDIFAMNDVEFIDCYLSALSQEKGFSEIYTFDDDFNQIEGVERGTP